MDGSGPFIPEKTLIDNPDVKFWFVLGPEYSKMPGISKSEPRLDPAFLDVSEKNLKSPTNKTSHNHSKKSISPHEGRDSRTKTSVRKCPRIRKIKGSGL